MKKLTTPIKIIILFFLMISTNNYAQKLEKIKGSKVVTLTEIQLDSIKSIELYKNIDLILKKGTEDKLTIYADDNLADIVNVDLNEGKLELSLLRRIVSKKKFELTLYVRNLSEIILDDNSTLTNNDFFDTDDLHIVLNNKSICKCLFDSSSITFEGNDTSKSDSNFKAQSISYTLKDRSKIIGFSNSDITKLIVEGRNTVTLTGKTDETYIKAEETSNLKLVNLISKIIDLEAEDKASLYVNATEDLTIKAKDDTSIYIYGKPEIDLIEFKGTATLHKKE